MVQTMDFNLKSGEQLLFTNFSNGWIIEKYSNTTAPCESWLLLPGENMWSSGVRFVLYLIAMIYFFVGIAIGSDIFMCSIEVITSKKRTIVRYDEERQEPVKKEVLIWNETVANLTLMALGSSAPEILIAVIEAARELPAPYIPRDSLGVFTIIGSASFNLLIITAICIVSVPSPEVKKIREVGVFILTSFWSIWAYVWVLLVVTVFTPGVIDIWEACVTLAFFPVLVLTAWMVDNGFWIKKAKKVDVHETNEAMPHVKIINQDHHGSVVHHPHGRELIALENEKKLKHSHANLRSDGHETDSGKTSSTYVPGIGSATELLPINNSLNSPVSGQNNSGSTTRLVTAVDKEDMTHDQQRSFARARFRHAAINSILGHKKSHSRPITPKPKMVGIVDQVRANSQLNQMNEEDMCGKFTFAAPSYSVLESAGTLEVDVLFHRKKISKSTLKVANGGTTIANNNTDEKETTLTEVTPMDRELEDIITGVVSVDFETREGTAKMDKDFKFAQGKLIFHEEEFCKTISIPIVADHQWEGDNEFYVILKNPQGDSGLGDPSVTRVLIIDDDEHEYRKTISVPIINDLNFHNNVEFYVILKNPDGDAGIGDPSITRCTIVDDDEPGEFTFEKSHLYADPSNGVATATVMRQKGCDGTVTIEFSTIDGLAKGGPSDSEEADYVASGGILEFKHGETSKEISVQLNKALTTKGFKNFIVALRNPSLGAKIGEHSATVVNLTQDEIGDRIAEILDDDEDEKISWGEQFRNSMKIEADEDEDGNEIPLKWYDYALHFVMFAWKIFFAFIPPTHMGGGGPAFCLSLAFVGFCTAVVETLGHLLGCVVGLYVPVTGITIVAFGTSLPDTFASRTAALQDDGADAAIGNITGSNSVNVFLGLGLPWVMSTLYYYFTNKNKGVYTVSQASLPQSVIIFTTCGTICIIMLLVRRVVIGGELGGSKVVKWACSIVLLILWFTYIIISAALAYGWFKWEM